MTLTATEKKRAQRDRRGRGARVIRVEVPDWEAWCEILMARDLLPKSPPGARIPDAKVAAATSEWIGWDCREYWRERAFAAFVSPVVGVLDRETGPYASRLIKAVTVEKFRQRSAEPND